MGKCNCKTLTFYSGSELPIIFKCEKCGKLYVCSCQKKYYDKLLDYYKRKYNVNLLKGLEYKDSICHLCTKTEPNKIFNYSGISKFAKKYYPYIKLIADSMFGGSYLSDDYTSLKFSYSEIKSVEKEAENIVREKAGFPLIKERKYTYKPYYIIIFEAIAKDGKYGLGLFYTQDTPHLFVYNKCKNWIKYGFTYGNMNMIYCFKGNEKYNIKSKKFIYHLEEALLTYKESKYKPDYRQFILENYLKYFFIKTENKSQNIELKILRKCCRCEFEKIEKYSYSKPKNKWVQEELLYNTIKKLYPKYNVIYQYRPDFLKSDIGGQLSYDIFIKDLNIAIEYQGKQHFEPIDFFGGKESFERTVIRDNIKKELSNKYGIKLIYFEYNENITIKIVKDKIENCLK